MATQEKIIEIPLNKIVVDYGWNSRSGVDKLQLSKKEGEPPPGESGITEENEFHSLADSIARVGQEDPIDVVAKGDKFFVVTGFRRMRALTLLAERDGKKDAVVKAVIKTFTPFEARLRNIRENTARRKLTGPDTARALVEARKLCQEEKREFTIGELAATLGIGRPYASRLFQIEDKVQPAILRKWHNGNVEVGVNEMERISAMKPEKQEKAFDAVSRIKGSSTKSNWVVKAEREAIKVGAFLGHLEYLGLISTEELDFNKHAEVLVKMGVGEKKPTGPQRAKIVKALDAAYQAALSGPKTEDEDENEDEDEDEDEE
jgi:uncharacterized ParB-like nuclease family protein